MTFFHLTRELQFHAFYNLFTHHLFTKELSLAEFFFLPLSLINILTKVKVKTQPDRAQKKKIKKHQNFSRRKFSCRKNQSQFWFLTDELWLKWSPSSNSVQQYGILVLLLNFWTGKVTGYRKRFCLEKRLN